MDVVFLWPHDLVESNRAKYQRAKHLSKHHNLVIIRRANTEYNTEISNFAKEIYQAPGIGSKKYINYSIYYLYAFLMSIYISIPNDDVAIHTFPGPVLHSGFAIKKITGSKWVADIVDDPALELQTLDGRKPFLKYCVYYVHVTLVREVLGEADLVIVQGMRRDRGLPGYISKEYNVTTDRIIPVPNGVEFEETSKDDSDSDSASDSFTIFYLGTMKRARRIDTFVRAMVELKSSSNDYVLELLGPVRTTEDYTQIQETIEEFGLQDNIEFTGKRVPHDEAIERMSRADICVINLSGEVSQYRYAHPIKVFEYMAMGKPIVASKQPGLSEILVDGFNTSFTCANDPEEFAKEIKYIKHNPEYAENLAENAKRSAKWFDWELIHENKLATYPEIPNQS